MFENFDLYEFVRDLSLIGWVIVIVVMIGVIYVIAKGTEMLVTRKCPYCSSRVPKRSATCPSCKKQVI